MKELSGKEETRTRAAAHQTAMQPWWQKRTLNYQQHDKNELANFEFYDPAKDYKNTPHLNYQQRPITDETYGPKSYSDPTKSRE